MSNETATNTAIEALLEDLAVVDRKIAAGFAKARSMAPTEFFCLVCRGAGCVRCDGSGTAELGDVMQAAEDMDALMLPVRTTQPPAEAGAPKPVPRPKARGNPEAWQTATALAATLGKSPTAVYNLVGRETPIVFEGKTYQVVGRPICIDERDELGVPPATKSVFRLEPWTAPEPSPEPTPEPTPAAPTSSDELRAGARAFLLACMPSHARRAFCALDALDPDAWDAFADAMLEAIRSVVRAEASALLGEYFNGR